MLTPGVKLHIHLLNVMFNLLFSSFSQHRYAEVQISRSISVSPLEFEITRVDCIGVRENKLYISENFSLSGKPFHKTNKPQILFYFLLYQHPSITKHQGISLLVSLSVNFTTLLMLDGQKRFLPRAILLFLHHVLAFRTICYLVYVFSVNKVYIILDPISLCQCRIAHKRAFSNFKFSCLTVVIQNNPLSLMASSILINWVRLLSILGLL